MQYRKRGAKQYCIQSQKLTVQPSSASLIKRSLSEIGITYLNTMRLSNDDESQDSSEQQIIKKLTELFPQLELEEESLLNWEVELAESIDTYGIEEAIAGVAHFEPDIEPTIHDRNISTVLDLIKGISKKATNSAVL